MDAFNRHSPGYEEQKIGLGTYVPGQAPPTLTPDMMGAGGDRNAQLALAQEFLRRSQGQGPSAAPGQFQAASDQALGAQAGAASGGGLAARNAMMMAGPGAAAHAAGTSTGEALGASSGLGALLGQTRGQDIGAASAVGTDQEAQYELQNKIAQEQQDQLNQYRTQLGSQYNKAGDLTKPLVMAGTALGSIVAAPFTGGASLAAGGAALGAESKMAHGGLVTKPTVTMLGENGPELVIPLKGHIAEQLRTPQSQLKPNQLPQGPIAPLSSAVLPALQAATGSKMSREDLIKAHAEAMRKMGRR